MFCDRCGTNLPAGPGYCPTCGKAAGAVPRMPVYSRLAGHIRLLSILWIAISVFRLIPGLVVWSFFRHGFSFLAPEIPMFLNGFLRMAGTLFLAGAVIGIVAGWGLLHRRPWARTLAIVAAVFNLLDMPFGTALGVYTLWVLLPAESEREYREEAQVM